MKDYLEFREFIIENLKASSIIHKDSKRVFRQMWEEHQATEAKLKNQGFYDAIKKRLFPKNDI
jgi:hypothetical protein